MKPDDLEKPSSGSLFLGTSRNEVFGSQTDSEMDNRDFTIESRDRSPHQRGRVDLDEERSRFAFAEYVVDPGAHTPSESAECLIICLISFGLRQTWQDQCRVGVLTKPILQPRSSSWI